MKSPSVTYDSGESTTLMSSDADSLDGITEMFHETWAQVIEVVIGLFLLASEVGLLWPLPLFLIFCKSRSLSPLSRVLIIAVCSHVSRYVAKQLEPRQKAWNNATQARVAATSSMLSSMKTIKMLGFQDHLVHLIQKLRREELLAASKLRWIMVYYNASGSSKAQAVGKSTYMLKFPQLMPLAFFLLPSLLSSSPLYLLPMVMI
jgi:hypothetical protein